MSCARENDVLQLGTEWIAPAEEASILAHLAECSSCAETAKLTLGARTSLRGSKTVAVLSAAERRSIARSFTDRKDRPRSIAPWSWAFGFAAAAAAALFAISTRPPDPVTAPLLTDDLLTRGRAMVLPEHTSLSFSGIKLTALSAASIEIAIDRELLKISDGALAIELGERGLVTVMTPTMNIEGVGAAFRVDVEAGKTNVIVERGSVEVAELASLAEPRVLAAGESIALAERRAPAVAQVPRRAITRKIREETPPPRLEPAPPLEPTPVLPRPIDVGELIDRADKARRAKRSRDALALYTEVAEDPAGAAYAEYSMLWRARLLEELGERSAALEALEEAEDRFPEGELAVERVLLEVKILLARGDGTRAASSLERLDDRTTLLILEARIDAARMIARSQPNRALALIRPALSREVSESVRRDALALETQIRTGEKK